MTRTIPIRMMTRAHGERTIQIKPRWAGKNLAIHKPVFINGDDLPDLNLVEAGWCITHIHTGMAAGRFEGSLKRAMAFARQWDEAWSVVTGGKVPQLLRRNYLSALAEASNGPSRKDLIEARV